VTWKWRLLMFGCLLAFPGYSVGQTSRFTANIGGGFSEPVQGIGSRLNTGWNITGGAGVNVRPRLSLLGEFLLNDSGINKTALQQINAPNGSTRIWAFTAAPRLQLTQNGRANFYVIGGGGVYHRTVEFTQPALATVTVFDPWWGVFYPANVLTNQIIGSYGVTKGGLNAGGGLSFTLGHTKAKFYAEARYHHMFTKSVDTTIAPVTFGIRW